MSKIDCPNLCGEKVDFSCSCCGGDNHHFDCSAYDCEKHWKHKEKGRLWKIKSLSSPPEIFQEGAREKDLEFLAELKQKIGKTAEEYRDVIENRIKFIEKRLANPENYTEKEEDKKQRLVELKNYTIEAFYSQNKPKNTFCPHWNKLKNRKEEKQFSSSQNVISPRQSNNSGSNSGVAAYSNSGNSWLKENWVFVAILSVAAFSAVVGSLVYFYKKNAIKQKLKEI